jgi:hypothetical protein
MRIDISKQLYEWAGTNNKVQYLLDNMLGYADRSYTKKIVKDNATANWFTDLQPCEIPDSLGRQLLEFTNSPEELSFCANLLLMTAFVMGGQGG